MSVRGYSEHLAYEPMPGPLNGPSMALGTRVDLESLLDRMDPLDQDVINYLVIHEAPQRSLANILGRTQTGMSIRLRRATEILAHLAAEPSPGFPSLESEIESLLSQATAAYSQSVLDWLRGTLSFRLAVRGQDGSVLSENRLKAKRHATLATILEHGSDELVDWIRWRLRMPERRASWLHPAVTPEPTGPCT